jgi:hypothetical protein
MYLVYPNICFRSPGVGPDLANGQFLRRTPSSRPGTANPHLDGRGGGAVQQHHIQYVTLIVHKDENGYGMKVSGDKPVYVQSVTEGKWVIGACWS